MTTFKNCKVIMLPTKDKGPIVLGENLHVNLPGKFRGTNFHLYIVSDDKIEKGDWMYDERPEKGLNVIRQCPGPNTYFGGGYWKIIATTDVLPIKKASIDVGLFVPSILQSFIKHYVAEYNKGNIITDVQVEYENVVSRDEFGGDFGGETIISVLYGKNILKINPDNTINIKQMKDSWTREEVIQLLKKLTNDHPLHRGVQMIDSIVDDWVEQNL